MKKATNPAYFEFFSRSNEDLQTRRKLLLDQRTKEDESGGTIDNHNKVSFTNKKSYLGNEYRLIVSNHDPSIVFLIDEEDYTYLNQFSWTLREKNGDKLLVTKIMVNSKIEEYGLRHVLTGGKLKKSSTSLVTVHLNRQKRDNRLSNLANTDTPVPKDGVKRPVDQKIYNHFVYEFKQNSRLLSSKKTSRNQNPQITKKQERTEKTGQSSLTEHQKRQIEINRQTALERRKALNVSSQNIRLPVLVPILTKSQRDQIENNRQAAIKRREERNKGLNSSS